MISLYLKYFLINITATYTYYRLLSTSYTAKCKYLLHFILVFLSSYFAYSLSNVNAFTGIILMVLCNLALNILITNTKYAISFATTIISYGITYCIYTLSSIIITISFLLFYKKASLIPYAFTDIPSGTLSLLLVYFCLQHKRLRQGITHIIYKQNINTTTTFSIIFVFIASYLFTNRNNDTLTIRSLVNIFLVLLAVSLLYYWRHRIKQTYIENLRRLEILTYENTITEKDKQIKELEKNNTHLGQIIHKYTKVIPAMELSVMELLQNNEKFNNEELKQKAESLQTQLETLQNERDNLLDKYQKGTIITTQTGLHTVDAMLALMEKRAKQEWIRYQTHITPNIRELAAVAITEADLLHLLGDLFENAFHAVSSTDSKEILIHFGTINDCFLLEISDSGIAFDIQTYQNWGNEPFTSHKEDGGTGTGLMDIWRIKKEYKASLYIYEYETNNNIYTKKISFLFDGKNHFLLKTYRNKEVKKVLIRGDLHVFPHNPE